jgi:hypothetical protein
LSSWPWSPIGLPLPEDVPFEVGAADFCLPRTALGDVLRYVVLLSVISGWQWHTELAAYPAGGRRLDLSVARDGGSLAGGEVRASAHYQGCVDIVDCL